MTEITPSDPIAIKGDPDIREEVSPQSPGVVFWNQMRKSPLALAGGLVLAIFYLLALFAPFVAPYPQEEMDRAKYFHPPQTLHWVRADGSFSLRPYVRDMRVTDMSSFEYEEDPSRELPVRFFVRGYPYELMGFLRPFTCSASTRRDVSSCSAAIRLAATCSRGCCMARRSR